MCVEPYDVIKISNFYNNNFQGFQIYRG